jgi:hypothetical protein
MSAAGKDSKDTKTVSAPKSSGAAAASSSSSSSKQSMADKKVFDDTSLFDSSEDVKALPSFEAMGLKEDLLRGIFAYGAAAFFFPLFISLAIACSHSVGCVVIR